MTRDSARQSIPNHDSGRRRLTLVTLLATGRARSGSSDVPCGTSHNSQDRVRATSVNRREAWASRRTGAAIPERNSEVRGAAAALRRRLVALSLRRHNRVATTEIVSQQASCGEVVDDDQPTVEQVLDKALDVGRNDVTFDLVLLD